MIEIIGKIVLCLVIALLLGFLIGWLFAKALGSQENYRDNELWDELDSKQDSKLSIELAELEVKYEKEKALVAEYSMKNRELKGELMKKISLLESTSNTLKSLQTDAMTNQDKGSTFGENQIRELKNLLDKKNRELLEFESVLVKAEETINELKNKK